MEKNKYVIILPGNLSDTMWSQYLGRGHKDLPALHKGRHGEWLCSV